MQQEALLASIHVYIAILQHARTIVKRTKKSKYKYCKLSRPVVRFPENFHLDRVLLLRDIDCALRVSFRSLVGVECSVALIAELVVLDLRSYESSCL